MLTTARSWSLNLHAGHPADVLGVPSPSIPHCDSPNECTHFAGDIKLYFYYISQKEKIEGEDSLFFPTLLYNNKKKELSRTEIFACVQKKKVASPRTRKIELSFRLILHSMSHFLRLGARECTKEMKDLFFSQASYLISIGLRQRAFTQLAFITLKIIFYLNLCASCKIIEFCCVTSQRYIKSLSGILPSGEYMHILREDLEYYDE